jgi:uncharacterized membrane protein YkoI
MKATIFSAVLVLFILFTGCSEPIVSTSEQIQSEQQIISKTLSSLNGKGSVAECKKRVADDCWEVKVLMDNGAVVKFEYSSAGALREVKGMTGPFNYELNLGDAFISYEAARLKSLSAKNGEITSWKFEHDASDIHWEYRFFITDISGNWELRLHAETGSILRIKQK